MDFWARPFTGGHRGSLGHLAVSREHSERRAALHRKKIHAESKFRETGDRWLILWNLLGESGRA